MDNTTYINYPIQILILTNHIKEWENYYKELLNNYRIRKCKYFTTIENDGFQVKIKLPQVRILGEKYHIIYYDFNASQELIADMNVSANIVRPVIKIEKFDNK